MRSACFSHFRCPDTQRPLRLEVVECRGDEVREGRLMSEAAGTTRVYPIRRGIADFVSEETDRSQTVRSFAQKWSKHRYYREHTRKFYTDWYLQRYGFLETDQLRGFLAGKKTILDAGTGMGRDAVHFLENSTATVFAVDTARAALDVLAEEIDNARFVPVRADLDRLPFPDDFFDFINCDQVIHHLPDPRATFKRLSDKLKPGGHICCYVYKKKAVLREFCDDHLRSYMSGLPIEEALKVCEGITHLGRALAELNVKLEVQEDIPALGIAKGAVDLQRFIHWNVMKCFWNKEFDFFTNNMVNFDWYHPEHCHRFEPAEFRAWFDKRWEIEAWDVQDAGISCRARKV